MSVNKDVRFTFGAVLGGAFFSTTQVPSDDLWPPLTSLSFSLSGALCIQAILYVRYYPKDPIHLKALVRRPWIHAY